MENKNETVNCKSCREYFIGECFGKPEICEFYRFKPPMTEEKRMLWQGKTEGTARWAIEEFFGSRGERIATKYSRRDF